PSFPPSHRTRRRGARFEEGSAGRVERRTPTLEPRLLPGVRSTHPLSEAARRALPASTPTPGPWHRTLGEGTKVKNTRRAGWTLVLLRTSPENRISTFHLRARAIKRPLLSRSVI